MRSANPLPFPSRSSGGGSSAAKMDFLKHNWMLKLISLIAAVVLAVYVYRDADQSKASFQLSVPINAPQGLRVKAPLPGFTVRVDLEGPSHLIREITLDDLHLAVD